jgi:hypothetical protein
MTSFAAAVKPPPIPSKYDIIPIHASDRGAFKRCRRKWDWSSPMRNNLVPRVDMQGVTMPLWFGSGIHYSLAQYYSPALKRDPVETFTWWWDVQMNGGILREDQMDLTYDRQPQEIVRSKGNWVLDVEKVYKVRGLYDLLPTDNFEVYEEHRELGLGMLTYYKDYAEREDNFAVICEEHTFSIPILDPDGNVLTAVDPRDGKVKEVHIRGTQDAIIQDLETAQFGIMEHKSAISIDENYHRKLEKDEQCTTYMYAAEREADIYGLEYDTISFTLYNAIRKAFPRYPTPLKSGLFSVDRQKESTTYPMLMEYIERNGLQPIVEADEKLTAYVDYVKEAGDKQFIERTPVRRNRAEIKSCGDRIYMEAMDMLDPEVRIYPNPTGDWSCLGCIFRAPCIAADDGTDPRMLINDNFVTNWTR